MKRVFGPGLKKILYDYNPSSTTYKEALNLKTKLSKMNSLIQETFVSRKMASRIFAFIESKYTSRIEGIYTTLFDVVNTGAESNQEKLIKPIVNNLFYEEPISKEKFLELESIMNFNISKSKRYEKEFGIYNHKGGQKIKIYIPPMDPQQVSYLLDEVLLKIQGDQNIIEMIHSHIIFEKIHPFADANGRLGRLLFQKSLAKILSFAYVVPISWAFYKYISVYYEAFDIEDNDSIDLAVQKIMMIIDKMIVVVDNFVNDVKLYIDKYLDLVKQASFRVNEEIAARILLTLQTKSTYFQNKHQLNPRTIDKIFEFLKANGMDFNIKFIRRQKCFWNLKLEQIIDAHFN